MDGTETRPHLRSLKIRLSPYNMQGESEADVELALTEFCGLVTERSESS